jgi:hypothetical protein
VPRTFDSREDFSLNLFGEFLQLPNFKNLMQTRWDRAQPERQLSSIEGGYMKSAIFAVVLLTLGLLSLPVLAQQQDLQDVIA